VGAFGFDSGSSNQEEIANNKRRKSRKNGSARCSESSRLILRGPLTGAFAFFVYLGMALYTPQRLAQLQEQRKKAKRKPAPTDMRRKPLEVLQQESELRHRSGLEWSRIKKKARLERKLAKEEEKRKKMLEIDPPYVLKEVNWEKVNQILNGF